MVGVVNTFQSPGGGRENILSLKSGDWTVDGVPVTASAAQLNGASTVLKGTLPVMISSAFVVPEAATLTYEKIGDICFVSLSTMSVLTTTQLGFLSIMPIPVFLCSQFNNSIVLLRIGTTYTQVLATIRADGELQIFSDLQGTMFPNPTSFSFSPLTFNYRALAIV